MALPMTMAHAGSKTADPKSVGYSQVSKRININNAGIDELVQLPGIGPKKAELILRYVKENGKFKSLEDIMNVKGIGPKILKKISPYITI